MNTVICRGNILLLEKLYHLVKLVHSEILMVCVHNKDCCIWFNFHVEVCNDLALCLNSSLLFFRGNKQSDEKKLTQIVSIIYIFENNVLIACECFSETMPSHPYITAGTKLAERRVWTKIN